MQLELGTFLAKARASNIFRGSLGGNCPTQKFWGQQILKGVAWIILKLKLWQEKDDLLINDLFYLSINLVLVRECSKHMCVPWTIKS